MPSHLFFAGWGMLNSTQMCDLVLTSTELTFVLVIAHRILTFTEQKHMRNDHGFIEI